MVVVAAHLAAPVVSFEDFKAQRTKVGQVSYATVIALPVSMCAAGFDAVLVLVFLKTSIPSDLSEFGLKPAFA